MSRCVVYQSGGFTNYGISYRKYSQEELAEMENRAMTGNEKTINILEHMKNLVTVRIFEEEALNRAIKALEEVQQYRKHGVTLESALNNMCDLAAAENLIEEYRAIGTPEECRAAMEKQTAKKNIVQKEIRKSIEAFEHPSRHICVEKYGTLSYSSDLVRAFEIAIELLNNVEHGTGGRKWED